MSPLANIRLAVRGLARTPALALTAIATLVVAVAFNVASISVLNALLLRPYRYPGLDQLLLIRDASPRDGAHQGRPIAVADFLDLHQSVPALAAAAAWRPQPLVITSPGSDPERVEGIAVSANFFAVLGVMPLRGVTVQFDADQPGRDRLVALSRRLWNSRFGADPLIVGREISVNGRAAIVAAIIRDEDCYPPGVDAWIPLVFRSEEKGERAVQRINSVSRMAPGASIGEVRSQLSALAAQLASRYPLTNRDRTFATLPLRREQYEFTAPLFLFVQAAALLVLLLAAVNVSSLFVARMLDRRSEVAVRAMLGAKRRDIVAFATSEVLAVGVTATVAGMAAAVMMLEAIRASLPEGIARWIAGWSTMTIDRAAVVSGFGIGAAVVCAVSITVALTAMRAIRSSNAGVRVTRRRSWARRAIVAGEMSLAAALLLGASVTVRGLDRIAASFDALDPARLLGFTLTLPESRYPNGTRIAALHADLLKAIREQPQVASAALIRNLPASNVPNPVSPFQIADARTLSAAEMPRVDVQAVSAGAFDVLRLAIVEGRGFGDGDVDGTPRVGVVSQEAVRRFWSGRTPIGATIRLATDPMPIAIVGVVSDFRLNWYDPGLRPVIYLADSQSPARSASIIVRTRSEPASLARQIRAAVARLDDRQPVSGLEPMMTTIADSLSPVRVIERILVVGAVLAVLLAAVGIYGVLAQSVSTRRREFGVRFAIGASPRAIAQLVLREAGATGAAGIGIGIVAGAVVVRVAGAALLGVPTLDVRAIAVVVSVASSIVVLAALTPAVRAARVDVAQLLRLE